MPVRAYLVQKKLRAQGPMVVLGGGGAFLCERGTLVEPEYFIVFFFITLDTGLESPGAYRGTSFIRNSPPPPSSIIIGPGRVLLQGPRKGVVRMGVVSLYL